MKLTDVVYGRLRNEAKALGFNLVPESNEALTFMKRRTYEDWRANNPETTMDFETWCTEWEAGQA